MYKVYVDGNLVYHPLIEELALASGVVGQEVNCAGTFVYKMYPNNTYYHQEKKLKSIVKVYNDTNLIFKGRVLNSLKGFYKSRTVTCEGALSFLLDSVQRPYEFSGTPEELFEQFLDSHNEQMANDPEKQFAKGIVTVTDPNDYIARSDSTYMTTRESMTKKLVDLCGGYIRVRYDANEVAYLDYLEDFTTINSQTVEFGKNLLDLEEIVKGEDIATCIIPLGAAVEDEDGTEQKLTIADVNDGVDYVYDEDAVATYGHIFKVVEHEDVTLASNLLTKGYEDLQDWVNLIVSISLTAVDLSAVDKSVDAFEVGSYTRITSSPHDFDDIFLTRKRTINILDPSDSTLELGEERSALTDKTVETNKNMSQIVETVETVVKDYKINEANTEKIISSDTAPDDTTALWCDTSVSPNVLKKYNSETESWEETNQPTEEINALRQELSSMIEQESTSIEMSVSEKYYSMDDVDTLIKEVSTSFEETSTSFEMRFEEYEQSTEELENSTAAEFSNISKYIRFEDGNIILGESGNEMTLVLENDRMSFQRNGVEVMYITEGIIYITDGNYVNSLKIGNHKFQLESNGSLSLKGV